MGAPCGARYMQTKPEWNMEGYDYLWEGGPEMAQSGNIRFGTDAVLLGNFVYTGSARKGIDLGCASGIIMLLLLSRSEKIHMTGIELDEEAALIARENMVHNGLESRSEVICGDLREYKKLFRPGSFDVVVSNPPYFPISSGDVSPDQRRASARGETTCTLENLCECCGYLCRWGGSVNIVYKPERLVELFAEMTRHGIEPKRIRMVAHREGAVPSLVLVEGRRGGNPGLRVDPQILLRTENDEDTEEIKRIYHRK